MRFAPLLSRMRNERGQVIIFIMIALVFLLVIAGSLASDVAKLIAAKWEVQSALDAGALAGAGKLGFDDTVFGTARDFAVNFARANGTRTGAVALERNDPNLLEPFDSTAVSATGIGDVLLGIWDPSKPDGIGPTKRFEPSTDGARVNSVMCRYKKQIAGNFMSLWGLFPMNVAAAAVATANPPQTAPPDACLFPIGVGSCPFFGNTSLGCGATITFITSSGTDGAGCLAPPCSNTAAWVGIDPALPPNPSALPDQIAAAASGNCSGSPLKTGDSIATNNGMQQPVMNAVRDAFIGKYNASEILEVTNSADEVTYRGKGWKVYIPIIETDCPAGAITGDRPIVGWTEFVMTQVINNGNCAVDNPWRRNEEGNPWDAIGKTPNCLGTNVPENSGSLRAIFGYYSCTVIPVNPNPLPGPRSALATKLRLVR